jgi:hypothetical protein
MVIGGRVCFAVAVVALSAGCGQAAPHGAGTSKVETAPVRGVREVVRTVWPVDASVVWAWTAVDALGGTEHIVRTRDAGGSWSDVTPAGLTNQSGVRRINSLFVLDGAHAWTTYGGITGGAAQTVDSTADGGRHWSRPYRLPSPGCALDFVSPDRGWPSSDFQIAATTSPSRLSSSGVNVPCAATSSDPKAPSNIAPDSLKCHHSRLVGRVSVSRSARSRSAGPKSSAGSGREARASRWPPTLLRNCAAGNCMLAAPGVKGDRSSESPGGCRSWIRPAPVHPTMRAFEEPLPLVHPTIGDARFGRRDRLA